MKEQLYYDVIVSGIGSMGAAACYYLAQKNVKVLGIEQFDIPHENGSHAGQTRIIRKAYFEDPAYVPMLERAYRNWHAIQEETGQTLYYKTGLLYHGRPDHPVIQGTKLSASLNDIELTNFTAIESHREFPQFKLPGNFISFIEPDAGFLTPEKSITTYVSAAVKRNADIKTHEKVISWTKSKEGVEVTTNKDIYFCKKLIITAGAWSSDLAPTLKPALSVTRQILAWLKPNPAEPFELGRFPCWMLAPEHKGGVYYGFPILPADQFSGPVGLKLAHHYPGASTDPDNVDRNILQRDEEEIRDIISGYFAIKEAEIATIKTCLYTNTRDENFIIDFLPGQDEKVIIACGFSGHGFKFVSAVGDILADLALEGKTSTPIAFLSINRG